MIINLYLKVATTIMLGMGASCMILGGLMCDGPMFDHAVSMLWFGLAALLGGLICDKLRYLPND